MLTGNAGTSDLVGMPAMHDLGSLHYVLNMVSFNYETLNHQVVARVLMTRLTVSAYKTVFGKVLVGKNP